MIFLATILAATLTSDPKTDQVDADFRALGRIASLSDNLQNNKQVMLAIVDADLENLREKRTDESYRWASLQREEASRVKDQKSIERVQTEKELREVTLTAANAYRVEVAAPTKQGLVTRNNRVFIRNAIVDATGFDGKVTHAVIPVNQWVNPGDSYGVALPEIDKTAKVTVELGVESGDKHAVADVALLQAKLTDDPASPYFPAVQRLLKIREVLTQKDLNRGFLKSTVDEALLSMPGELQKRAAEQSAAMEQRKQADGTITVSDASPDVVAVLEQISHLLGGTLQDQTDARARLQTLIDTLEGKPAVAPKQ